MVRQVLRVNFLKEEGNRELFSNTSFGEGYLNFAKFNVEHEFLTNVTIGQLLRGNSQEKKVSESYPDRTDSAMRRWSNVFLKIVLHTVCTELYAINYKSKNISQSCW